MAVEYPGSVTQSDWCPGTSTSYSGCYPWVNLANVKTSSDSTYTYIKPSGGVTNGRGSRTLQCRNFGFSVPKNARIDTVWARVRLRNNVTSGSVEDRVMKFTHGDTANKAKSANWPYNTSSPTTRQYDADESKFTRSQINSSSFGFDVQATGANSGWGTPVVSWVQVGVGWTTPTYLISSSVNKSNPIADSNDQVNYTVTIKNTNNVKSTESMIVSLTLPSGVSSLDGTSWTISSLGAGSSTSKTFRLTTSTTGAKTITTKFNDTGSTTSQTLNPQAITYNIEATSSNISAKDGQQSTFALKATCNSKYGNNTISVPTPSGLIASSYNLHTRGSWNGSTWTPNYTVDGTSYLTMTYVNQLGTVSPGIPRTWTITASGSGKTVSRTITYTNDTLPYSLSSTGNQTKFDGEEATFIYTVTSNSTNGSLNINFGLTDGLQLVNAIPSNNGTYNPNNNTWNCNFTSATSNTLTLTVKNTGNGNGLIDEGTFKTFNITASGTNVNTLTRSITYYKDTSPPPTPPTEELIVPRDIFISEVYDGTSIEYDSIIITEGDELLESIKVPKNKDDTENIINPKESLEITSTGPYIIPLGGPAGKFTTKVKNITDKDLNVLLELDLDITNKERDIDSWIILDHIEGNFNFDNETKELNISKISAGQSVEFDLYFKYREEDIEAELRYIVAGEDIKSKRYFTGIGEETIDASEFFEGEDYEEYPVKILIMDMPFLTMDINGPSDIDIEDEFELEYTLYNNSNVDAEDVKTKITIPKQFEIISRNDGGEITNNNVLEWDIGDILGDDEVPRILKIIVRPLIKGRFITKFSTKGYKIWPNEVYHTMDVGIWPTTTLSGKVDKSVIEEDEELLLTIDIKNNYKLSKNTLIHIDLDDYDILDFDTELGYYQNGIWYIGDLGVNISGKLIITLKSTSIGYKTINVKGYRSDNKLFRELNIRNLVIEKKPKVDFIVTQDTNFVMKNDEEFIYNIKLKNLENKEITNLHFKNIFNKAIEIIDTSNPDFNIETNSLSVVSLGPNESIDFIITCKINIRGNYTSIFTFIADKISMKTVKLLIKCDDKAYQENIEHKITIFNFDKLKKYYRLNIDEDAKLQKTINRDNLSTEMVDIEHYNAGEYESYSGRNLSEIVDQINDTSIYVESKFMRKGENALKTKLYQLWPNGFIYRFGLLRSEIFHHTGVIPKLTNMIEYAMRWDVDKWGDKVWPGDLWDNGVFRVGIPYEKIPTNFIVPTVPELQKLIDKTRPAGTKGLPFYTFKTKLGIGVQIQNTKCTALHTPPVLSVGLSELDWYINSYRWDNINKERILAGKTENGKILYGSYYNFKTEPLGISAQGKLTDYNFKNSETAQKIGFNPIKVQRHSNIKTKQIDKITDYIDFQNIQITKKIPYEGTSTTEEITLQSPTETTLGFSNAEKHKIIDQIILDSQNSVKFELTNQIEENTEFGIYLINKDKTVRFARNKDELENGIKITITENNKDTVIYSNTIPNVNEYEKIYLNIEKIENDIMLSYSFNEEEFIILTSTIFNKLITEYGIYTMKR